MRRKVFLLSFRLRLNERSSLHPSTRLGLDIMKLRNKYFILRHGQTIHQTKKKDFIYPSEAKAKKTSFSSLPSLLLRKSSVGGKARRNKFLLPSRLRLDERMFFDYPPFPESPPIKLTKKGQKQIKVVAKKLKKSGIDLIFSSDFFRTRQTAKIVAEGLNKRIHFDKRLRDVNLGIYRGGPKRDFYRDFPIHSKNRFNKKPPKGESWRDCQKRMLNFLKDIDKRFKGKTILIISHGDPLWLLEGAVKNWSLGKLLKIKSGKIGIIKTGEFRKL